MKNEKIDKRVMFPVDETLLEDIPEIKTTIIKQLDDNTFRIKTNIPYYCFNDVISIFDGKIQNRFIIINSDRKNKKYDVRLFSTTSSLITMLYSLIFLLLRPSSGFTPSSS